MIDAHNHLQDPRFDGHREAIVSAMQAAGITQCVVNGTSEDDWAKVTNLSKRFPDFVIPAFGLHPWKVASRSESWFDQLEILLKQYPEAIIGECGLDRWMQAPNLSDQHQVFHKQLNLGLALDRPVTIHCLEAWGPLLEELKRMNSLPRFLLHSFGGSQEVASELVKLGAYFSFSGYFLHPRKTKIRDTFASLPPDRILVETDAPDMPLPDPAFPGRDYNHPANLDLISRELSKICALDREIFTRNTERFLGLPTPKK